MVSRWFKRYLRLNQQLHISISISFHTCTRQFLNTLTADNSGYLNVYNQVYPHTTSLTLSARQALRKTCFSLRIHWVGFFIQSTSARRMNGEIQMYLCKLCVSSPSIWPLGVGGFLVRWFNLSSLFRVSYDMYDTGRNEISSWSMVFVCMICCYTEPATHASVQRTFTDFNWQLWLSNYIATVCVLLGGKQCKHKCILMLHVNPPKMHKTQCPASAIA